MADLARSGGGGGSEPAPTGVIGQPVPAPSTQYRTARGGELFQVNVPSNWQALSSNSSVKFVPQNGYGEIRGERALTHGVELGVARASSRDLREATQTLVEVFVRGNPELQVSGDQRAVRLSNRSAIGTPLVGRSALGGQERVGLYTTLLADGNLFYYITVVPSEDAQTYAQVFERVGQSIRLNDR